ARTAGKEEEKKQKKSGGLPKKSARNEGQKEPVTKLNSVSFQSRPPW
ncbi:unnamed protein product, partial [marine sediment metagenome]